ncbi:phenylalanine--tRNA ligase subunit alpha [Candidatus Karelsulcia muelleri]|uniref:phenylalanine--tRNA ligase subunit alpha n=1 Tax=Candidatus Karelsulcia muelleri TaxID=336810 RepID=UPI003083A343
MLEFLKSLKELKKILVKLNLLFKNNNFQELEKVNKKKIGRRINTLKQNLKRKLEAFNHFKNPRKYENEKINKKHYFTKPGKQYSLGTIHPISIINNKIILLFQKIGFELCEGPEIEDDWHNFTALNFPLYHPARDMHDTFFIKKSKKILRTHTSSIQIRFLEKNIPPIRIISPGRVYRNEKISSSSHCVFHQIEGLYISKNVSFKDLKKTINYFIKKFFSKHTIYRFRPSYFPFTEPSAEVDILDTTDANQKKWIEILGCGMVHPKVLINVNINPELYSGFAFGLGIERMTLIKYKIPDIRIFFENDIRFLKQFKKEYFY